jgi:hypothetical protein
MLYLATTYWASPNGIPWLPDFMCFLITGDTKPFLFYGSLKAATACLNHAAHVGDILYLSAGWYY